MSLFIGNTLKEARTKKSLSFEDVQAKTKIHPRVLQLLEDEKFDKLPSPLFAKSFLKTYAEFLEINPEEILRSYEKDSKKEPEQVLFIKPVQERERPAEISRHLRGALPIVIFTILIVTIGFYSFRALAGLFAYAKKQGTSSVSKSIKKAPVKKASEAKKVSEAKKASAPAASVAAVELKMPEATGEWIYRQDDGTFPKVGSKTPVDMKVSAQDDVWMRITTDGKVVYESVLKSGAAESWSAKDSIEVWTGNFSNMRLAINGFRLKNPAYKGVIKKMLVSREGIRLSA